MPRTGLWDGTRRREIRARLAPLVASGDAVCGICGLPIAPEDEPDELAAMRRDALRELRRWTLPADAPGAWIRQAIDDELDSRPVDSERRGPLCRSAHPVA